MKWGPFYEKTINDLYEQTLRRSAYHISNIDNILTFYIDINISVSASKLKNITTIKLVASDLQYFEFEFVF